MENTIKAFVDKDQYEKFLAGTQEEVKDSGSMIENIDVDDEITYKEALIPTDQKYLLIVMNLVSIYYMEHLMNRKLILLKQMIVLNQLLVVISLMFRNFDC